MASSIGTLACRSAPDSRRRTFSSLGGRVERFLDSHHRAVLEAAGQLLGAIVSPRSKAGATCSVDGLGLTRHQVAADPFPDRLERHARDAAGMIMGRGVVDQKWLERLEEQARQIARAFRRANCRARRAAIPAAPVPRPACPRRATGRVRARPSAKRARRDAGLSRYCRNRSTRSPSAIRFTLRFHTRKAVIARQR